MRVLLTGGSGQVGTEVQRRASRLELIAPARAQLDLANPAQLYQALRDLRPDAVLSVGAYTAVDRAEDEPELAFRVNGEAVQLIADYCREMRAPLIHLSTDYVFDGLRQTPFVETDATVPTGVYGRSKLAGELAARSAPEHLILRVSWVFAAQGANFVKTMLRLAQDRPELCVVDDQVGGPTWAGHIADTVLALLQRWQREGGLPWGTYHYSGAPALSWCDFARVIFAEAQASGLLQRTPAVQGIRTEDYPTRAVRPANSRLDMQMTTAALGLSAPDWRDGLRRTLSQIAATA